MYTHFWGDMKHSSSKRKLTNSIKRAHNPTNNLFIVKVKLSFLLMII